MKKTLTFALILALLLLLSVPALAADPEAEVRYFPSVSYQIVEADTEEGYHVEIWPSSNNQDEVDPERLFAAAAESDSVKKASAIQAYEVVEIVMVRDADNQVVDWEQPIRVVLTYDKTSQVVAVFIQNDDGSWSEIQYEAGDGTMTLYLPHLSLVAFALGTRTPTPGPGDNNSPQTGYNTVLWLVLTAALAAAGALCFVRAGRKAEA